MLTGEGVTWGDRVPWSGPEHLMPGHDVGDLFKILQKKERR